MSRDSDGFPPRIKAAFEFLYHTRMVTWQVDPAVPMRALTPVECRVEHASLWVLQQYLSGEMAFAQEAPAKATFTIGSKNNDEDAFPTRVSVVLDFLEHARRLTEQINAAIPVRGLTPMERQVELAALRVMQQYLLGEMAFADVAAKAGDAEHAARE